MTSEETKSSSSTAAPKDDKKSRETYVATMCAGGISGFWSRFFFHPIDTCKAKLQVQTKSGTAFQFGGTTTKMWNTAKSAGGIRELYKGFGIAGTVGIPASMLYFTSFSIFQDQIKSTDTFVGNHTFACDFTAGFLAEAVSC